MIATISNNMKERKTSNHGKRKLFVYDNGNILYKASWLTLIFLYKKGVAVDWSIKTAIINFISLLNTTLTIHSNEEYYIERVAFSKKTR